MNAISAFGRLIAAGVLLTFLQPVVSTGQDVELDETSEVLDATEIKKRISELSSNKFAKRELASEYLVAAGPQVVPLLIEAYEGSSDPELRLRTKTLIKQLKFGDLETRINTFLAGNEVDLEGWGVVRVIFGDSNASRDLFVDMYRKHPQMMKSLAGSSRELALAMEKVAAQTATNKTRLDPTLGDAVAMLLPATDPKVPVGVGYEDSMMFIINRSPVNRVRKDKLLGIPFRRLLAAWINRSSLGNREEVLNFALEWEIPTVYSVAIRTLDESDDPIILATAMQVFAQYGHKHDSQVLMALLDDDRVAEPLHHNHLGHVETKVCDTAMAAIAILNGFPLKEIGFSDRAKHDTKGFLFDEVGYPANAEDQRQSAIAKIKELNEKRIAELNALRGIRVVKPEDNES